MRPAGNVVARPAAPPLAEEILRGGLRVLLRAHGSSMTPWIRDGDMVELEPLLGETPRPGDVVFCSLEKGLFRCHRLIRLVKTGRGAYVLTKGDWLSRADRPVPLADCVGRVRAVIRQGRPALFIGGDSPLSRVLSGVITLACLLSPAWTPFVRRWLAWKAAGGSN